MKFHIENNNLYLDNHFLDEISNGVNDYSCKYEVIGIGGSNKEIIPIFDSLNKEDLMEDFYLRIFDNDFNFDIWKKDNISFALLTKHYYLKDWEFDSSITKFCKNYSLLIEENKNIENIKVQRDYDFVIIKLKYEMDNKNIREIKDYLIRLNNSFLEKISSPSHISKSIHFTPEHFIAGTSILQYFGKLLQEKYPNENVSVSIKQEGLKVTLVIDNPDGKKEEIEEYLNKYGMVITNQITASEFTTNPIQILELETKLESAKMEIGFQKKLLALQDKTYDVNLVSLKDEVNFLREELSSLRTNNEQVKLLLSSLLSKDKLIKKLTKSIDKKDEQETKQLLLELKNKDKDGYISLKQHIDTAVIGGIVNAPSWIQFTIGIISKL